MPVTIDQIEVEATPPPERSGTSPATPAERDPREIERALEMRRDRLARVYAH